MFSNYLLTAWRNIKKQKGYSLINLSGLAIGMACCLLILLFVQDELSFDRYHDKADRIYRLAIDAEVGGSMSHFALAPFAAPPVFADEIPEVESYVRIVRLGRRQIIEHQERSFEEEGIFFSDKTFFNIFSHAFKAGNAETSLDAPGSVVITEDTARRLFGEDDPLGKILTFEPVGDLHVTGVIRNVPRNSHFTFNYMISFTSLNEEQRKGLEQWLSIQGWAYLLLQKDADPAVVEAKFPAIVETHTGQDARTYGIKLDYFLQKMTDIHLRSKLQGEIEPTGDMTYVIIFAAIALFILLIACINFMNLSTARSANRAREVGLRKVFGSFRRNLVGQFLAESTLMSLAALLLAIALAALALPLFNSFSGKELAVDSLFRIPIIAGMLLLIVFTGFLAGSYPAFFLSGFQPIAVLRGMLSRGAKGAVLRKILVVFQFAISVALIIGTGIVLSQINYMKNKNLGFDKDQVLVVLVQTPETAKSFQAVKAEMLQLPSIRSVSFSSGIPGRVGELRLMIPEGKSQSDTYSITVLRCDHDFITTYGMTVLAGRDFSREFTTDATEAYIINATAAGKFGWSVDEAVNKDLTFAEGRPGKIIGVIEDFHYQPLQFAIEPLVLMIEQQALSFASMKIDPRNVAATLAFVEEKWSALEPGREFDYFFVDDDFAARYEAEERLGDILRSFALLAIFIACLGLFGLASYTAEQRTREIGIRKVLGASPQSIVIHLSKEFVKWVIVANVLAWPAAYLLMKNLWLANFPYRTSPAVWTFLISGVASVIIALLTVSFQVVRASAANPADSIRYE